MPQGFLRTKALPPACLSPCDGFLCAPTSQGCPECDGGLRTQPAPYWWACKRGLDDCLAGQGASCFGHIQKGLDRDGGPTISRMSASLIPGSGESRILLAGSGPLPLGSCSLWLPLPSPQGVPGVRGGGELEVGAGACRGVQRRLQAPVGLGGGHPRANRAR